MNPRLPTMDTLGQDTLGQSLCAKRRQLQEADDSRKCQSVSWSCFFICFFFAE